MQDGGKKKSGASTGLIVWLLLAAKPYRFVKKDQ
jgi:hypothetical protein